MRRAACFLYSILCTLTLGLGLAPAAPAAAAHRAYFVSTAGRLLELRLDGLEVAALWDLDRVKNLGERFPARSVEGTYLANLAFASDSGDVYLAVPADRPEKPGQLTTFRILRVKLPRWDIIQAEYRLPIPLEQPPEMALRPDSGELYIEYQLPGPTAAAGDRFVREIRVLDRLGLREIRTLHSETPANSLQLPPGQSYPFFSPATHFVPGLGIAYNRGTLIHFGQGRYVGEPFDFRAALSPEQAKRLASRFGTDPRKGGPRVAFTPLDAIGRWALARAFGVQPDRGDGVLVVADLVSDKVIGVLDVPPSAASLLPDGRVLIRELASPPRGGQVSRSQLKTSGKVEIFDPRTGRQVAGFTDDLLAGKLDEVNFLCATRLADLMFFRTVHHERSELVVTDSKSGRTRLVRVDFRPDRATRCFFFDESP